ncbi:ABC transporter permease [Chitinimonas lacunae]|uniref:ABC transporter permease n=1 Tax=Chitinimonas lacunae TaxID=1963018 RepID=A0ABV8MXL8_9NEIS
MTQQQQSQGYWKAALKRLWADNLAKVCIAILGVYFVLAFGSALGLVAADWNREVGVTFANPSYAPDYPNPEADSAKMVQQVLEIDAATRAVDPLAPYYEEIDKRAKAYVQGHVELKETLPLGGDKWGRDLVAKVIKAGEVSISIGLTAAVMAVMIGTLLGALGGYFGGKVSDILEWFYNIFTSVPYILLVLAFAAVVKDKGILTVVLVLALTGWTSAYRLIRAEYMKHRSSDYVLAANALGASHRRMMFVHILPNVSHLILVQLSQLVIEFIKAEVVLSFLGFGVPTDSISWGIMINEVMPELVLGKWWQLLTVGVVMSTFVVAFGLFTDLLRDALDPKASRR